MRLCILLLLIAFVGCIEQTNVEQRNSVETTTGEEITNGEETADEEEVKIFEITAEQFSFEPDTITVKKGDDVRLIITSIDVIHGFRIEEFGIDETLEPGKTVIVEFTADKTGAFTFYCTVYCGSGHGSMRGRLVVEE